MKLLAYIFGISQRKALQKQKKKDQLYEFASKAGEVRGQVLDAQLTRSVNKCISLNQFRNKRLFAMVNESYQNITFTRNYHV